MQTKVIHVDPKTLKLLEMNARFMRHEEFQRLACVFYEDGPGLLVHPLWQVANAYFVSLRVEPTGHTRSCPATTAFRLLSRQA